MTQKTYQSGRQTFCLRQSEPGAVWNLYYLLSGRCKGQMTWVATSDSDSPADLEAAISRGRRNGEF